MIQLLFKHKIQLILGLLLLMVSCQNKKTNESIRLFELLPGQWKMTDQDDIESWELHRDFLKGVVMEISESDTIITEEIKIIDLNGQLIYEATVKNQNEGKPIAFQLVHSESNKWIFENTGHDFPQQIEYLFVTNDSLVATIKGELIGKTKSIEFVYLRQK